MVKQRSQQSLSGTGLFDRVHNSVGRRVDVVGDVVGQVGVLGMRPDLLCGVEVRRVGWKPFDQEFAAEALHQPPCSRSVDRPTIQDQDDPATNLAPQRANKILECIGIDVVIVNVEVQPEAPSLGRERDRRNNR